MDEEKRPLSEEEAIAFAGVTDSTLHRYISAGFINPVVEGDQRFFDEDELIQVFELSPKRAAASRKALKKKALSPAEKLISEKDRLVADKDIQIRDLKDQRSWLQSRVERLEAELVAAKTTQGPTPGTSSVIPVMPAAMAEPSSVTELIAVGPQVEETTTAAQEIIGNSLPQSVDTALLPNVESNRSKTSQAEGSLKKVLRYLGFIKPEPALLSPPITSRASEIIALDRTGERAATVPPSHDPVDAEVTILTEMDESPEGSLPISSNVIEVKFPGSTDSPDAPITIQPAPNHPAVAQTATTPPIRGNRPFRESKQTLAELLGDDRPLDPSFAANEESE